MRSEPPTGDELTRLLVSMKRNVLEQAAAEPEPAKRSRSTHRIIGLGVGVTLLLGLGAGAAFALGIVPSPSDPIASTTAPASSTTPTAAPTAPPVEYAVTAGQPESRHGLDCATLVDDALVADLFTAAVEPVDPIVSASGVGNSIPRSTYILAVGGTVCEWSSGVPMNTMYGSEPQYVGVTASVVPRPSAGWSDRAERFGMPRDDSTCADQSCFANAVVGDAWVYVQADGGASYAIDQEGWQPFVDAIVATVAAAGPAAPPTFTEHTSRPSLDECEALIPLDRAQSITSTPDAHVRLTPGGGAWSEYAEAQLMAGAFGCGWAVEDLFTAHLTWVQGGRWAYQRMLLAGTTSPVELAGLPSGDTAVIRCDERAEASCAVDLTLGLDWFDVWAPDAETAITMAEELLAQRAE